VPDKAAVVECLRSGWITSGPKVAELEGLFREATGAPHAVAVASATAGLHIVLAALGVGPGDEVVTPSLTFASTVNQIALRGATPVFAECDYGTLLVRPADLAAKITNRTKAVIPVHFAGAPADLDPIRASADRAGVPVIEDAAHAVGTSYKGIPLMPVFHPAFLLRNDIAKREVWADLKKIKARLESTGT